jgi:chanoclavine-I dehydrogenase
VQFHSGNSTRPNPCIPLAQHFNENPLLEKEEKKRQKPEKEEKQTMADSRVFSITGGASGIGAATARLLAQRGASALWIADKNPTNFQAIKDEIQSINPATQVYTHQVDVSMAQEVDEWIDKIMEEGPLHGSANVAGLAQATSARNTPNILEETNESWKRVMGINIDGIFYCTRAQVRAMKAMPRDSHCSIVNVASMIALFHVGDTYGYGTSKAACAYFSTSVSKDVHPFGIRVNSVSPGKSRT